MPAGAVAAELLERRVARHRVDQAAERQQLLHLAALQVADEVPLEGVAPALVLGDEVLLAVLADQRHPGLGQRPHLLQRHVLASRRGSRPRARRARGRAPGWRRSSPARGRGSAPAPQALPGSSQARPACRPVTPPSRRWEKKSSGSQLVQRPAISIRSTPASRRRRRRPRRGRACGPRRSPRRGRKRPRGPPRRPRSSRARFPGPTAAAVAPTAAAPAATYPGGEAAPAAVEHRHAARARERDRQAVGDEDERRQPRVGGDVPVDLGDLGARLGERARHLGAVVDRDLGAVDLPPDHDQLRRAAESGGQPAAVVEHRGRIVVGEDAEVEALVGRRR